ncbi:13004_t:CDS:2 [Cetraspora pellucida]|uniref:13004_t:CDS:1 n=1 Tax=Cetraspora pellucida TaxID=1433469 RepID=A0A9N9NEG1_9GLOM|nr:13004_t:CDS:2 [Cetraspora pellucida]
MKSKHKTQSDDLSSSDNVRKIKKSNSRKHKLLIDYNIKYVEDTESTDDEVVNDNKIEGTTAIQPQLDAYKLGFYN